VSGSNIGKCVPNEGFEPIGWDGESFKGVFDGQGHTISNLYINRMGVGSYGGFAVGPDLQSVGLFGRTNNLAEIRNVILVNVDINGGDWAGGLVGSNYGLVENSQTSGSVTGSQVPYSRGSQLGGLAGNNYGDIKDSSSSANVYYYQNRIRDNLYAGQLVGLNRIGAEITGSSATGIISGIGGSPVFNFKAYIGGLVGYEEQDLSTLSPLKSFLEFFKKLFGF